MSSARNRFPDDNPSEDVFVAGQELAITSHGNKYSCEFLRYTTDPRNAVVLAKGKKLTVELWRLSSPLNNENTPNNPEDSPKQGQDKGAVKEGPPTKKVPKIQITLPSSAVDGQKPVFAKSPYPKILNNLFTRLQERNRASSSRSPSNASKSPSNEMSNTLRQALLNGDVSVSEGSLIVRGDANEKVRSILSVCENSLIEDDDNVCEDSLIEEDDNEIKSAAQFAPFASGITSMVSGIQADDGQVTHGKVLNKSASRAYESYQVSPDDLSGEAIGLLIGLFENEPELMNSLAPGEITAGKKKAKKKRSEVSNLEPASFDSDATDSDMSDSEDNSSGVKTANIAKPSQKTDKSSSVPILLICLLILCFGMYQNVAPTTVTTAVTPSTVDEAINTAERERKEMLEVKRKLKRQHQQEEEMLRQRQAAQILAEAEKAEKVEAEKFEEALRAEELQRRAEKEDLKLSQKVAEKAEPTKKRWWTRLNDRYEQMSRKEQIRIGAAFALFLTAIISIYWFTRPEPQTPDTISVADLKNVTKIRVEPSANSDLNTALGLKSEAKEVELGTVAMPERYGFSRINADGTITHDLSAKRGEKFIAVKGKRVIVDENFLKNLEITHESEDSVASIWTPPPVEGKVSALPPLTKPLGEYISSNWKATDLVSRKMQTQKASESSATVITKDNKATHGGLLGGYTKEHMEAHWSDLFGELEEDPGSYVKTKDVNKASIKVDTIVCTKCKSRGAPMVEINSGKSLSKAAPGGKVLDETVTKEKMTANHRIQVSYPAKAPKVSQADCTAEICGMLDYVPGFLKGRVSGIVVAPMTEDILGFVYPGSNYIFLNEAKMVELLAAKKAGKTAEYESMKSHILDTLVHETGHLFEDDTARRAAAAALGGSSKNFPYTPGTSGSQWLAKVENGMKGEHAAKATKLKKAYNKAWGKGGVAREELRKLWQTAKAQDAANWDASIDSETNKSWNPSNGDSEINKCGKDKTALLSHNPTEYSENVNRNSERRAPLYLWYENMAETIAMKERIENGGLVKVAGAKTVMEVRLKERWKVLEGLEHYSNTGDNHKVWECLVKSVEEGLKETS